MKAADPLKDLKDLAIKRIEPFLPQVGRKAVQEARIRIRCSATALEVKGYYNVWQQKLDFLRIATLPDLDNPTA